MPTLRALLAMCAVLATVLASGVASAWTPPLQMPASTWTPPPKEKTRVRDFSNNPHNRIMPLGAELRPGARKSQIGYDEGVKVTLYLYAYSNPLRYTDPTGHTATGNEAANSVSAGLAKFKEERNRTHQDMMCDRAGPAKATACFLGATVFAGFTGVIQAGFTGVAFVVEAADYGVNKAAVDYEVGSEEARAGYAQENQDTRDAIADGVTNAVSTVVNEPDKVVQAAKDFGDDVMMGKPDAVAAVGEVLAPMPPGVGLASKSYRAVKTAWKASKSARTRVTRKFTGEVASGLTKSKRVLGGLGERAKDAGNYLKGASLEVGTQSMSRLGANGMIPNVGKIRGAAKKAVSQGRAARAARGMTPPSRQLAPPRLNPTTSGSPVFPGPAPKGTQIDMAMAPGQTRPGGFGTPDIIPDTNFVRNELAVIPEFKPEIGFVQRFEVPEGAFVQFSEVGPQVSKMAGRTFPGRGRQLEILNFADRQRLVPVGPPRPIAGGAGVVKK